MNLKKQIQKKRPNGVMEIFNKVYIEIVGLHVQVKVVVLKNNFFLNLNKIKNCYFF